jgi:hypothetical protein
MLFTTSEKCRERERRGSEEVVEAEGEAELLLAQLLAQRLW